MSFKNWGKACPISSPKSAGIGTAAMCTRLYPYHAPVTALLSAALAKCSLRGFAQFFCQCFRIVFDLCPRFAGIRSVVQMKPAMMPHANTATFSCELASWRASSWVVAFAHMRGCSSTILRIRRMEASCEVRPCYILRARVCVCVLTRGAGTDDATKIFRSTRCAAPSPPCDLRWNLMRRVCTSKAV